MATPRKCRVGNLRHFTFWPIHLVRSFTTAPLQQIQTLPATPILYPCLSDIFGEPHNLSPLPTRLNQTIEIRSFPYLKVHRPFGAFYNPSAERNIRSEFRSFLY
ncbi:hypothetical protein AVEN_67388-1 [Araneus ventricosus]|uniref:Uncharacterized protein n=1 Tax=Araneus ventricosus TaxID=182803 RepID=A0A4Y2N2U5_ARAVE|nr:hypothetical protein AVEN_67388-1 [Araneus ventricosus]